MARKIIYSRGRDLFVGCIIAFLFVVSMDALLLQHGNHIGTSLYILGEVAASGIFVGLGMMALGTPRGRIPGSPPPQRRIQEYRTVRRARVAVQ